MTITIACPLCQRILQVPASEAGQINRCGHCQELFQVPDVPPLAPPSVMAPPLAEPPRTAPDPVPAPRQSLDISAALGPRQASGRRQVVSSRLGLILLIGGSIVSGLLAVVAVLIWKNLTESEPPARTPTTPRKVRKQIIKRVKKAPGADD